MKRHIIFMFLLLALCAGLCACGDTKIIVEDSVSTQGSTPVTPTGDGGLVATDGRKPSSTEEAAAVKSVREIELEVAGVYRMYLNDSLSADAAVEHLHELKGYVDKYHADNHGANYLSTHILVGINWIESIRDYDKQPVHYVGSARQEILDRYRGWIEGAMNSLDAGFYSVDNFNCGQSYCDLCS